ncbi:MAG: ComF family protein [Clostridiales bacterium]|jgi:ComF family protein|nr:ComF family protein [Clostridiales bacterium]
MKNFIDWLYPPACISCRTLLPLNENERFICVACNNLLEPIGMPFCKKCGSPMQSEKICASCYGKIFFFENNRAAFTYDELIRDMIRDMKFRNKKRIALGFGMIWARQIEKIENTENTFFLPIPLHPKKQRERGFNQAEILTKPLSEKLGIPISHTVIRTVDTPPQAGLHFSQRVENVRDIFEIRAGESVAGKNYIITDDIFTTGSSLNECAKLLINNGAAHVSCMTFAISVKNNHKV